MFKELDTVVLTRDTAEHGLKAGDVGTIVHVYEGGVGFEVEFVTAEGRTVAVLTLRSGDIRSMAHTEILHARELADTAQWAGIHQGTAASGQASEAYGKLSLYADPNGMLFVTGTRVSFHSVVGMFEEGASAEEIAHEYDALELADIYAVITYYFRNRDAVRSKLASEEVQSEQAAHRFERSFPKELRVKLLRGKQGGG